MLRIQIDVASFYLGTARPLEHYCRIQLYMWSKCMDHHPCISVYLDVPSFHLFQIEPLFISTMTTFQSVPDPEIIAADFLINKFRFVFSRNSLWIQEMEM